MASFQQITSDLKEKIELIDPSKMKGMSAVYQFDLSGDNGGIFHVIVAEGSAVLEESEHDKPNITISMTADDFVNMLEGKLNATSAFMAGKLKIKGDMSLAMKLQGLMG